MGCAVSAPQVDKASSISWKQQDVSFKKEQLDHSISKSSTLQAAFGTELAKLVGEATSSVRPADSWVVLIKCADLICSTFGLKTCSFILYTASGLHCKMASNSGSILHELAKQHPDVLPAETLGFVTSVVNNQKFIFIKSNDDLWSTLQGENHTDFHLLTGSGDGCTSLAVLPLCGAFGGRCSGAMLLGHTAPLGELLAQSWLITLVPMLSLFVSETQIIRTLGLVEAVAVAGAGSSVGCLAAAVTTHLAGLFEWCHAEDVEARLVVLGQDGATATVYCKSCTAAAAAAGGGGGSGADDGTSSTVRSGLSGSVARSGGHPAVCEEGLVGVHMSLDNTLTRRCLSGRQRLLFVADVMQALKLYGEPWKDVFFDAATVVTPAWVLAAPLVVEGRKLGAVLWLASCRVNSEVLMRTASAHASPVIHAIARCAALNPCSPPHLQAASTPSSAMMALTGADTCSRGSIPGAGAAATAAGGGGAGSSSHQNGSSQHGAGGAAGGVGGAAPADMVCTGAGGARISGPGAGSGDGGGGGGGRGGSSMQLCSSRQSSGLSRMGLTTGRRAGGLEESGDQDDLVMEVDRLTGGRPASYVPEVPVKYVSRHSPSTSALMRLYKSNIAQRAPVGEEERAGGGSCHEIRILSKAGEGAFGAVYVGRWRFLVVAVKIIRDGGGGGRALKTAWELAVNKSLSHPSIVTVHAILTDVHLQKTASRMLRFVPATTLEPASPPPLLRPSASTSAAPTAALHPPVLPSVLSSPVPATIYANINTPRNPLAPNTISTTTPTATHPPATAVPRRMTTSGAPSATPCSPLAASAASTSCGGAAYGGGVEEGSTPSPFETLPAVAAAAAGATATDAAAGSLQPAGPPPRSPHHQAMRLTSTAGNTNTPVTARHLPTAPGGYAAAEHGACGLGAGGAGARGVGNEIGGSPRVMVRWSSAGPSNRTGNGTAGVAAGRAVGELVPGAAAASGAAAGAVGGMNGSTGGGGGEAAVWPTSPPSLARNSAASSTSGSAAVLGGKAAAKSTAPKVHAIIMEYCNLGGLHKAIDNRLFFKDRTPQPQPPQQNLDRALAPLLPECLHLDHILATLSEVVSALQYLHAQGFVHCDLKPENVLLKEANNRRGFTAKLADFGLSELRSADGAVLGDLGGTVTHVAPESVLQRCVSPASDMYAFGILMWELYTGQQPYRALLSHISKREDRHRALLSRVVHEGLRPVFPPGVPQDYWSLAVQCWNSNPAARPTTGEVISALEAMYVKYAPQQDQQQQGQQAGHGAQLVGPRT